MSATVLGFVVCSEVAEALSTGPSKGATFAGPAIANDESDPANCVLMLIVLSLESQLIVEPATAPLRLYSSS